MGTKHLGLVAAGVLCAMAPGAASAANFITNGSFETGDLTGWTSTSGGLNPFGTTYGSGMDGIYWHWVGGYEGPITTTQTVSGLTAGQSYTLKFIMASEFSNQDQIRVSIDGGAGVLFAAPTYNGNFWDNWVEQQLTFVAGGSSAVIQFDTNGLNVNGYDVGLDNVRLDVAGLVPEPSAWALMILGFGAVGAGLRRRTKVKFAHA